MMLAQLLKPEVQELIQTRNLRALRDVLVDWEPPEIASLIDHLPSPDDVAVFRLLPRDVATDVFEYLSTEKQEELVEALAREKERLAELLNELSDDDRTALLEELPGPVAQRLLNMLSPEERAVATKLLGYPEESVGRLMTTEYVAVRPHWTVQQALDHIRRYGKDSETLNVIYVVDDNWRLLDDLRIRELLLAEPNTKIEELMDGRFVALKATDDQEMAVQVFRDYDRVALPVTDSEGVLLGIVTIDDVLDVAEEEATEDIQKLGGMEALEEPYLSASMGTLLKKRARWLVFLFLSEMFTATAMGRFEDEIARAVVLALFVPLIIASGGNSGSQAATLIIRAMAIGEVTLRDWWRVMRREIFSGLGLGAILGTIGFLRVSLWQLVGFYDYGPHWYLIGFTVFLALIGVVLWGTLIGSMLPFVLRRLGFDPAVSSAPFVATLVDVTGIIIYFEVARLMLTGTLL
ncbi:magnesium transporter [Rhodothermus bifroesti]|nr:magnesium transporter [Rhodothermus bifroesti]GBD00483.1 Magnesium transporter MgtE [bacterium HR18]